MTTKLSLTRWSISMMILALFSLTLSAEPKQRENALAKYYPEGFANIPAESQKLALKYVTAWMSAFSTLPSPGPPTTDLFKLAYEKDLLPIIQPLQNGSKIEKQAFEAGTKIYDALSYLRSRSSEKTAFDDRDLNELLRHQPGNENDPVLLAHGIGELLMDYAQLAAPDFFEKWLKQLKAEQK